MPVKLLCELLAVVVGEMIVLVLCLAVVPAIGPLRELDKPAQLLNARRYWVPCGLVVDLIISALPHPIAHIGVVCHRNTVFATPYT